MLVGAGGVSTLVGSLDLVVDDRLGIIRRIGVLASQSGTNPNWGVFALRNDSDVQIDRLLVAPFFRLPAPPRHPSPTSSHPLSRSSARHNMTSPAFAMCR